MLRVERKPGLASPTHSLGFLLCDHFPPLSDAEEVLLYLPDHLQGLGGAVECAPRLLEEAHLNRTLGSDDLLQKH